MKLPYLTAFAALGAVTFAAAPALAQETESQTTAAQAPQVELLAPETVRADLDALYSAMQDASVDLYAFRSKADFDAFHAGLSAQITGPMTRLEAALVFQRMAAFARIGHIRSYAWLNEVFGSFAQGARFAPLFIRVEQGGQVFLTDNANADASAPAGAQLMAINGEPIDRILARTRDLISAERDYMANTVLEDFFPALFWAAHRGAEGHEVELLVEGERVTAYVPAVSFGEFQSMDSGIPSLNTDFNAREFRMMDQAIAYLRPGPFSALEGEEPVDGRPEAAMVQFIDESFAALIEADASDLIIDLRNNPGGDISFSDPMVAWIAERPFKFASAFTLKASAPVKAHYDRIAPEDGEASPSLARLAAEERVQENGALYPFQIATVSPREGARFEGRVWVLVNRRSFSNATSTAALIKDYGFGTIMGEETADVPNSFASIFQYRLPGTGMTVDLTKSYFVRPSGDERVRGVLPEIELPRQMIGSASDTMLEAAIEKVISAR